MSVNNVLIIDDEEGLRKLLSRIISLEGYEVLQAGSLKEGLDILKRKEINVLLCDVKLPDGSGVDFVKVVKAAHPTIEIILLTAYGNIPDGVQAIKNGAFDYITKGNDNDKIIPLLAQASQKTIASKNAAVKQESSTTNFSFVIGKSDAIQQTVDVAKRLAPTNANVLLLGETGTGKEVFAKAIHGESKRSEKPFIAINCSAFTKDLLEGELFGHKAGAYTGATKDKKGLIETANGGTLFLDEIGELNIDLQAKLLRVLENGEFIKLGDVKTTKVDVRIIAATNRDLKKEVSEGHFREDLLYRLNTFTILLPPLRERKKDIPLLARFFLQQFSKKENKPGLQLSSDAAQALEAYSWKGNIRELRNVMERAVVLSDGEVIKVADLPSDIQEPVTPAAAFSLAAVEKEHIQKILRHTGNNKAKTAQMLGIGVATLYRKLEEYQLPK
jgi:DNA-binding NtrC family response regulator